MKLCAFPAKWKHVVSETPALPEQSDGELGGGLQIYDRATVSGEKDHLKGSRIIQKPARINIATTRGSAFSCAGSRQSGF